MRDCFLPPIPELYEAISLLEQAANSVLIGDYSTASKLILMADMPEICSFSRSIMGTTDLAIHRQSCLPTRKLIPKAQREKTRMPSREKERMIYERDGWRCRFCGVKVISQQARTVLVKLFPHETHWTNGDWNKHCALYALGASLDHILPHSRGGNNEEHNLITACGCCQFGRNQWTLEEVMFNDPRERHPVVDGWDGLTRLNQIKAITT